MITAALMAYMPSALIVTPQISMSNLSDMCSSPLKEAESLRGTIYLRAGLSIRQDGWRQLLCVVKATLIAQGSADGCWRCEDARRNKQIHATRIFLKLSPVSVMCQSSDSRANQLAQTNRAEAANAN